jgi:hypothetical protein
MADSASITPAGQPRLTDRRIGRRRLLALAAAAPLAAAIAKSSGGTTTSASSPPLENAAIRTPDPHSGTAYYFC